MRAGARKVRDKFASYLRRVSRGETVEITSHGKLVATLGPPAKQSELIARPASTRRLPPLTGRPLPGVEEWDAALDWARGPKGGE